MTKPQEHTNKEKKMFKIRNFIKNNKPFVIITLSCLLLPMIIELFINYGESKITYGLKPFFLKILYTLKEYKSYYATILTFSFAIFSYIQQQEEMLEEKQKESAERKKVERENIELKKRELEAEMDHYRPLFAVGGKEVKLIMKEPHLYLENIEYYKYDRGVYINDSFNLLNFSSRFVKSEETIIKKATDSFCITGTTQKGENVLFFNDSIGNYHFKTYKYVKDNNLLFPKKIDLECYTLEKINQIWGSYNTSNNNYNDMNDQDLFKSTIHITMLLNPFFSYYHEVSLNSISSNDFFIHIFDEIKNNYIDSKQIKNTELLYKILNEYINYIYDHVKHIEFNINIAGENDLKKRNKYNDLTSKIKDLLPKVNNKSNDDLCNDLFDAKLHRYSGEVNNILNIEKFLNIIKEYLQSDISQEKAELKSILEVLIILFSLVTFSAKYNHIEELNKLKGYSENLYYV